MTPFFFLLVDSCLGSAGAAAGLAGVGEAAAPAAGTVLPPWGAVEVDSPALLEVVTGAPFAGVPVAEAGEGAAAPESPFEGLDSTGVGLMTGTEFAGALEVPPAEGAAVGLGAVDALGSPGAEIIWKPELTPGASVVPGDDCGTASTGAASPPEVAPGSDDEPAPVTVKDGPAAPGRRTSVAETTSFGGFNCGVPLRAAVETSGLDFNISIGILIARL